jgi:hypothetical protein
MLCDACGGHVGAAGRTREGHLTTKCRTCGAAYIEIGTATTFERRRIDQGGTMSADWFTKFVQDPSNRPVVQGVSAAPTDIVKRLEDQVAKGVITEKRSAIEDEHAKRVKAIYLARGAKPGSDDAIKSEVWSQGLREFTEPSADNPTLYRIWKAAPQ